MPKEIELKLSLSPTQARRLLTHPLLAGEKPKKYRLFNTYYDTPELDLRKRGIALRLRRKGWAVWLMTVKGGDSGPGGLSQRNEWEAPTEPGVFDFGVVSDEGLRAFLEERHERLQAIFSTDFSRLAWTIRRGDSLIELVLDRGRIARGGDGGEQAGATAICEIELELLEGESTDELFGLAIELAADLHLHPEIVSKAERGYALVDGRPAPPVKAFSSPLSKEMSPVEAFRSLALSCLTQLQRNEAGAVAGGHPEYVHQARVAIRRLRCAFRLFAPLLADSFVAVYSPRWRDLAGQLGGARDWDVFLSETLLPLEEAFPGDPDLAVLRARGEAIKNKAQRAASGTLTQRGYSQLLLAFVAALLREQGATIERELSGKLPREARSLEGFARQRLQGLFRKVERVIGEHGKLSSERRHELRIDFKRLRYALEFFAPILPRKRLLAFQSSLAAIQDLLGILNDQVTASRLIKEMHPKGEPDPLTRGWIAGRTQLLLEALNRELRSFMSCKKPWR